MDAGRVVDEDQDQTMGRERLETWQYMSGTKATSVEVLLLWFRARAAFSENSA